MFIVLLTYKKPLTDVDKFLAEHRAFLDDRYKDNCFLISGPRNPRTGGVIISQLNNREQLESILKLDPFYIHDIASYEIIEFVLNKHHPDLSEILK